MRREAWTLDGTPSPRRLPPDRARGDVDSQRRQSLAAYASKWPGHLPPPGTEGAAAVSASSSVVLPGGTPPSCRAAHSVAAIARSPHGFAQRRTG
jgi:hypothetical protein